MAKTYCTKLSKFTKISLSNTKLSKVIVKNLYKRILFVNMLHIIRKWLA